MPSAMEQQQHSGAILRLDELVFVCGDMVIDMLLLVLRQPRSEMSKPSSMISMLALDSVNCRTTPRFNNSSVAPNVAGHYRARNQDGGVVDRTKLDREPLTPR